MYVSCCSRRRFCDGITLLFRSMSIDPRCDLGCRAASRSSPCLVQLVCSTEVALTNQACSVGCPFEMLFRVTVQHDNALAPQSLEYELLAEEDDWLLSGKIKGSMQSQVRVWRAKDKLSAMLMLTSQPLYRENCSRRSPLSHCAQALGRFRESSFVWRIRTPR